MRAVAWQFAGGLILMFAGGALGVVQAQPSGKENPFGTSGADPFGATPVVSGQVSGEEQPDPRLDEPVAEPAQAEDSAGVLGDNDTLPDGRGVHIQASVLQVHNAIRQKLAHSVTVEFTDAPLSEVVAFLSQAAGVPIMIERGALDDVGLGTDTPVTITLKDISLRSLLRLMLHELDLTYIVRDEVLMITTPEQAENCRCTRLYQVSDLATPLQPVPIETEPRSRFQVLRDVITAVIAPDSWYHVGGAGAISVHDAWGVLAVSQTDEVHERIEALLATIRRTRQADGGEPGAATAVRIPMRDSKYASIERALDTQVAFEFTDAPLGEIVDYLSDREQIQIVIDRRALDDVGLGTDTPVTCRVKGVTLRSAMRLLLGNLDLTYLVANEVLQITTPEMAEDRPELWVYRVGDLAESGAVDMTSLPAGGDSGLARLIIQHVQRDSWDEVGGAGRLVPVPSWGLLVVTQTGEAQGQIGGLLEALRRARASVPPVPEPAAAESTAVPVLESFGGPGMMPGPMMGPLTQPFGSLIVKRYSIPAGAALEEVTALIKGLVEPMSWRGTPGGPEIYTLGNVLVILQSRAGHQQIEQLLRGLGVLQFDHPYSGGMSATSQ